MTYRCTNEPERSGLLEVICEGPRLGRRHVESLICLCDCGSVKPIRKWNFISGRSKSCGCRSGKKAKHGHARRQNSSSEYNAWISMKNRCYNPESREYYNYGARGIQVCDQWKDSFAIFLQDMGPKPSPAHTLDRYPNNDGNYEPGNCRWATMTDQNRNKRDNIVISFQGESMCLTDWANKLGLSVSCLSKRLKAWPIERALTEPVYEQQQKARTKCINV